MLPSHTPLCDNVANRFMAWIKRLCWCKHAHGKQYQSCLPCTLESEALQQVHKNSDKLPTGRN